MTALRVGDLRIAEDKNWFRLMHGGTQVRRFSKKVWSREEVRAWRDGYVWGRDHHTETP